MDPIVQPEVREYILATGLRESPNARALREHTTANVDQPQMLSTPEQMQFVAFMVRLLGARRVVEVGVYTGYGTLVIAEALADDGVVVACDKNDRWPSEGKRYWREAGCMDKISLQIAPAQATLQLLLDEGGADSIDLVVIDADKLHYPEYYELSMALVRPGGMILFDNALWMGEFVAACCNPATRAVHQVNQQVQADPRVDSSLVPIGSGILLVRKR